MVPTSPATDEITLASLERVLGIVRQFLPPWYDTESISSDILLESWCNHQPKPSWEFVRRRCIDQTRRQCMESDVLKERKTPEGTSESRLSADQAAAVSTLIRVLDPWERKVVFYRFYLDLGPEEIGRRLSVDATRIRETLTQAIYKMKEEAYGQ